MNSKRKICFLVIVVSAALACLFALCGCGSGGDDIKSSCDVPQNLRVRDDMFLEWDKVDGAERYVVTVDGDEYTKTDRNYADIILPLFSAGKHSFGVKACAAKRADSAVAQIDGELPVCEDGLAYEFADDGGGIIVSAASRDKAVGNILIPAYAEVRGKTAPVSGIAENAFSGCDGLTAVVIAAPRLKRIAPYAFKGCKALRRIVLNDGIEKLQHYALSDCEKLEYIDLPESVNEIERAFSSSGLKKMHLSKSVKDPVNAIHGCDQLEEITIDDEHPKYRAAGNCVIDKNNGNIVRVLKSFTIPDDALSIGSRVCAYSQIEMVSIPSSIVKIGDGAFFNCKNLQEVVFGEGLQTIEQDAFMGCVKLKGIDLPASIKTVAPTAFASCPAVESITVAEGCSAYTVAGNCLLSADRATLVIGCKASVIPSGILYIGDHAFYQSKREQVDLPKGLLQIGEFAFYGTCLRSVVIPNGTVSIGKSAFESAQLTEAYIPDSVISIGDSAFDNNMLSAITFPQSVMLLPYNREPSRIVDATTVYSPLSEVPETLSGSFVVSSAYSYCCCFLNCELNYEKGYPYVRSFVYSGDGRLDNGSIQCNMPSLGENPGVPTRLGYVFKGWATDADSGDVKYPTKTTEDGRLTALTSDDRRTVTLGTKLYAVWEKA